MRVLWDWTDGCCSGNLRLTEGPSVKASQRKREWTGEVLDRRGVRREADWARRKNMEKIVI